MPVLKLKKHGKYGKVLCIIFALKLLNIANFALVALFLIIFYIVMSPIYKLRMLYKNQYSAKKCKIFCHPLFNLA